MPPELHLNGQGVEIMPEWREKVEKELAKLRHRAPEPFLHTRVEIIGSGHHRHGAFELHLVVSLPQTTLTIRRQGEFIPPLIGEAFKALDRVLKDHAQMRQRRVKVHEEPAIIGRITRLFPAEEYGFLETGDGLEVYFHANAVKKGAFAKLQEGMVVLFAMESGEQGPQATWVRVKD